MNIPELRKRLNAVLDEMEAKEKDAGWVSVPASYYKGEGNWQLLGRAGILPMNGDYVLGLVGPEVYKLVFLDGTFHRVGLEGPRPAVFPTVWRPMNLVEWQEWDAA